MRCPGRLIPLTIAAAAALLSGRHHAGAQTLREIQPGEVVRFDTVGTGWEGDLPRASFTGLTDTSVHLHTSSGEIVVDVDELERMQVRRGTSDFRWIGTAMGAAAGCGMGLSITGGPSDRAYYDIPPAMGCAIVGTVVASLGYIGGGAVKQPRWLDVSLDSATRSTRLRVGVRLVAG